jgi:hypothetical protein
VQIYLDIIIDILEFSYDLQTIPSRDQPIGARQSTVIAGLLYSIPFPSLLGQWRIDRFQHIHQFLHSSDLLVLDKFSLLKIALILILSGAM